MEGEGCKPGVAMDSGNPLLKAVYLRRLRLTRLLLEGGAYVNESDHLGQTPLMTACRTQHTDSQCASRFKLVQFLLEKGADPNIQDKDGKSALMHACRENAGLEVVSLLLASGADISLEDQSGTSALVYAVMAGDWKVLKLLLDTCKAKGKEVIIITTDQFPCGKLQAKQYLSIPTIAPLNPNQTDKMISGPASPSEIQLITSPKCNSTSLCPPKNVFSFKDDQNCGVSSHPSSPSSFQRLGKGKGPHYGLQQPLLRLNSEPWLKIPASLSHESVKDLNKTEEFSLRIPTPDGYKSTKSTMDSFGKDLLNQTGDFCLRIPTIDGPDNCANSTMDNFELYEQQLAREKLEEEEEDVNNKYGGQKISLPGLLSAHSVSHPNLHSSNVVTVSNSITQSLSVGKNLNHMASSSLQSIIQRRKLGADIYSSDPQLSVDLRNLPEDSNQRSRLAPLRCSSTMGSRESVVLLTSGPNRRVLSGLERRGSGAYLLDHHSSTSQARPRSLPPLLLKTNSQLNVCNVSSSAGSGFCEKELGLKNYHPCAPPGHPKDTTKRMLLRRHSMQTEQFKSTA